METVTKKSKKSKRSLSGVNIEKAANGFGVSCHYTGGEADYDSASNRHVFNTASEVAEFVKKKLGG